MRRRPHPFLATSILVLGLAASAWAQAAAPDTALDLAAALRIASQNNLELRSARLKRAQAIAGVRAAGQLPNPTLTFGAARDTPHESVLIDQSLELGGKRSSRIQLAQQEAKATDVEIAALERQIRHRTRDAFFKYVLARTIEALSNDSLKVAQRVQQTAQDRFNAGDVPQLEVIQASVETARAQVEQTTATQETKSAAAQLAALLNVPAGAPLLVNESLDSPLPAADLVALNKQASDENADIRKLTQELEVEKRRAQLLRAQRIPNLDLQFGSDFNSPPEFNAGPRGQVAIALPLFSRNQGELAQSSAAQQVLQLATDASRRNVSAQVEAAY